MTRSVWGQRTLFIALVVAVVAVQSWFLYRVYTSQFPGANDFIARWSNGCALIWRGENPYADSATLDTQMRMYRRPALPGEDQAAFSYPLYALFFFWPLCFVQNYAIVQAIWMSVMILALLSGVAVAMRAAHWQPRGWLLGLTVVWAIFNYPHLRALILGQMATLVFLATAVALLALSRRSDTLAGAALAVATLKPQMTFLLVLWLLWYTAVNGRRRFWTGFIAALAVLGGVGLLLVPTWPLDFVQAIVKYPAVAGDSSPYRSVTWMLLRHFHDLGLAAEVAGTAAFSLYLIYEWWRTRRGDDEALLWTTGLTLNITQFVAYRIATTSYSVLLLPLFQLFALAERRWPGRYAKLAILAAQAALLLVQWWFFLATRRGNFETVPVYLVLPIALLVAQLAARRFLAPGDRDPAPTPAAQLKGTT